MKYFVFSIDDGTVFDELTIKLFNKYHVKATFNLNSGLDNFTWFNKGMPITRFILKDNIHLYDHHEVSSHTLTHPYLNQCPDEIVIKEVKEDINNLERIFQRKVLSFATPFHTSGEREISLIKNNTDITNIRTSEIDESFKIPSDPYHYKITALNINRALQLFDDFIKDENAKLFIYAGHSYDFYMDNSFNKLEELLKKLTAQDDILVLTMSELTKILF